MGGDYIFNYGLVFVVFLLGVGLLTGVTLALHMINKREYGKNKHMPYECGFPPFSDARIQFDVKFYRIAIMFMVFDVEMALMFPFIYTFKSLLWTGFISVSIFFFILVVGFLYEWSRGALEWDD